MSRRLLVVFVLVCLMGVVLGGCGKSGPAAANGLPPLQGTYRADNGETLTFNVAGGVLGTAGRGTFTVDGDRVALSMGGTNIPGERTSADVLTFHPPGRSDATFYRLGSAAAQTAQAAPHRVAPTAPPKPTPDRSTPLDHYAPVADVRTMRTLQMAFDPVPANDDAKLALVPEAQGVADAFARRELATKALPAVNAELDAARTNRYYRVGVDTYHPAGSPTASGLPAQWWLGSTDGGPIALGPYDFTAKAFPMPCVATSTVYTPAGNVAFHPVGEGKASGCALPVSDDAVARRIESARASGGRFQVKAVLYFFVVEGGGNRLNAVLTLAEMTLLDPSDRTNAGELARVAFDVD